MAEKNALEIKRQIDATPEEVFDAWTDAKSVEEWLFSGIVERTSAKIDPRVGGHFEIDMITGSRHIPHHGEYLKMDRPRLLEFTWISEHTNNQSSVVTIELKPDGGGTMLTLRHRMLPDETSTRSHEKGWGSILDKIAERFQAHAMK